MRSPGVEEPGMLYNDFTAPWETLPILQRKYVFSEPGLLIRHQEGFTLRNEGPHRANEKVEEYLLEERNLGRIPGDADPRSAADLLLGSCFQRAFQMRFLGIEQTEEEMCLFVNRILDMLFDGLQTNPDE